MQHASEEKSSCYWLHRTFKNHYKQVRKSFNEIPELNSPAQHLHFYGNTQSPYYLQHKVLNSMHKYYIVFICHQNSQVIHKHGFTFTSYFFKWYHQLCFLDLWQTESHDRNPSVQLVSKCPAWKAQEWFAQGLDACKTLQKERIMQVIRR